MSYILQIETATTVCSVALSKNGKTLAVKEINERNIHAEVITVFIDELLKETGVSYSEVDAIAVSSGPGSYTGLRIGVSTAKGLCFALDKPLIAVETLEAMADGLINGMQLADKDILLCPMIDARRMEVYTAIFNANGKRIRPTTAEIIDANSFGDLLSDHTIIFFGDGAPKCQAVLGDNTNAQFVADFRNSAAYLSQKAYAKLLANNLEDVAYFEPFYLKDFIAGKKSV
ncbi:MAG: tRNA (adenosine(37)-N6)-threonylcarbamoyltransferase complex dimerization subunit type 1 TsaB [Mucilaginibacter sp.]